MLTNEDIYLFNEGTLYMAADKLGAHLSKNGVVFSVWAPNAEAVSVVGDWNEWTPRQNVLEAVGSSGIWSGEVKGVALGALYKFHIVARGGGYQVQKADPFAFATETPPRTASRVATLDYTWGDAAWMKKRGAKQKLTSPIAIYEVHLGSWQRVPEEGSRSLTYRELAPRLASYVKECGFTHVELMPVMEHPFYGSWGYQVTSYFAPSSRFGSPQDFMFLIDYLHQHDIGVILDWVPSHFPEDEHGLGYFDGTHLFEHADPRQGFHPDWKSAIFNYGRNEVRSFLISSAVFWLDKYHVDGLRVDGVASMLYLDYSRKAGEWMPNKDGGRENLEAIGFLQQLNKTTYRLFPDTQTYAEESTAWPQVSRPVDHGGLGFGFKWDMGWMHDTLAYFERDPIHRSHHQGELTFRQIYAYTENFVLSLSHDEVVHGKGSLLGKMPGDRWQKFANLRALFGYMYGQNGKKLVFMGGELGQDREWSHERSLDWHLLGEGPERSLHNGVKHWLTDLNHFYRNTPALSEGDNDARGFEWIDASDAEHSVISFVRWDDARKHPVLVVCNLTPGVHHNYRIGVPRPGFWKEALNSDAQVYGGAGNGNLGGADTYPVAAHGRDQSLTLTLAPLAVMFFQL